MVDDTQDLMDDRWLTTDAAARYLSCGTARVRYLVKTGRLRAARDVRRLIFKKSWLDDAVEPAPREDTR